MMIVTNTEIKHVENSFKVLDVIEIDLEGIMVEEFEQALSNDLESFH